MSQIPRLGMLIVGLVVGVVIAAGGIFAILSANSDAFAQVHEVVAQPHAPMAISQVLSYQGRLLTPGTSVPKPDGAYVMTFSLYNVATGGVALWTETKNISTLSGSFVTLLGDTNPLILGNFNGQELFLGIKVGDDAEASPRQRLAHAAYAMYTESAGNATTAINATNANNAIYAESAGNATTAINATNANNAIYAESAGSATTAINATNATNATNANNAIYAESAGSATTAINATNATNATSAATADTLDGIDSSAFSATSHVHDERYFTEAESNGGFINSTGPDAMAGNDTSPIFQVIQSGAGHALQAQTSSTDSGEAALYGITSSIANTGTPSKPAGVFGRSNEFYGVVGYSHASSGVYGRSNNEFGVRAESAGAQAALVALASGTSSTSYGVYASTASEYGLYTPNKIFAGTTLSDIAEHMPAAVDVLPGDVVVIDPDHDERVIRSYKANDPAVAGVISTEPAMLIGNSESNTPLALAGHVLVKVSAENGPIRRGDMLTTSTTPGHAMLATPTSINGLEFYTPGTIIGKAMGELEEGTGSIIVLILPQ